MVAALADPTSTSPSRITSFTGSAAIAPSHSPACSAAGGCANTARPSLAALVGEQPDAVELPFESHSAPANRSWVSVAAMGSSQSGMVVVAIRPDQSIQQCRDSARTHAAGVIGGLAIEATDHVCLETADVQPSAVTLRPAIDEVAIALLMMAALI